MRQQYGFTFLNADGIRAIIVPTPELRSLIDQLSNTLTINRDDEKIVATIQQINSYFEKTLSDGSDILKNVDPGQLAVDIAGGIKRDYARRLKGTEEPAEYPQDQKE